MRFIQPKIFDLTKVQAAVSTRNGGISIGYFSSLNMGKSTADAKQNVLENRRLFFTDLGIDEEKTALSYQVHGNEILKAENPCRENGYDALITDKNGLTLVVSVADCVPILIHDTTKDVVAAVHAGWKGTVAEIVYKTIVKMNEEYGCDSKNMKIYIGPCIGYDSFEVSEDVALQFPSTVKKTIVGTNKWLVDLKMANKEQAIRAGVLENAIEISTYCTFKDENLFFSHRRDKGNTGRMVAVIGLR